MDLDVCVDDQGEPYIGHSQEYHEKSGDPWQENMPLWEAVGMIAASGIVAIVDCKHHDAWPVVEEVVSKIGPENCLVHAYVSELRFDYSRRHDEPDFITEWSPTEKLRLLKNSYPGVSTSASCKWLPEDLSVSGEYAALLQSIRDILAENRVDTVCLNVPDRAFSDELLGFFLAAGIIPHVSIDNTDTTRLSLPYVGETDDLTSASRTLN